MDLDHRADHALVAAVTLHIALYGYATRPGVRLSLPSRYAGTASGAVKPRSTHRDHQHTQTHKAL